jgi:hypothetical protein
MSAIPFCIPLPMPMPIPSTTRMCVYVCASMCVYCTCAADMLKRSQRDHLAWASLGHFIFFFFSPCFVLPDPVQCDGCRVLPKCPPLNSARAPLLLCFLQPSVRDHVSGRVLWGTGCGKQGRPTTAGSGRERGGTGLEGDGGREQQGQVWFLLCGSHARHLCGLISSISSVPGSRAGVLRICHGPPSVCVCVCVCMCEAKPMQTRSTRTHVCDIASVCTSNVVRPSNVRQGPRLPCAGASTNSAWPKCDRRREYARRMAM